ncbi:MAG: RtcB family protein [Candidatus Omnitrophica bacterium]|nr:RtcB family protein [Candidatus Omnitrophota bacterium]
MGGKTWQGPIEKIDDYCWRIPKSYKFGMRVPGIIYADEKLIKDIRNDQAAEQVANVAFLPGIVKASLAMPDIHWGYGFPIGGVAATDIEADGVISPGGVGFDINCGVRLLRSNFTFEDIKSKLETLVIALFQNVPSGVGSKGQIRVSQREERQILVKGARWAVEEGFGSDEDLAHTEERGEMTGADPDMISERAFERGKAQSGTLGSGNHFMEIQMIDEIYDDTIANRLNLFKGQITLMIHSGSRGFGYQVCDDYIKRLMPALNKYNIKVPDRQLVCAPVNSVEGRSYLAAMKCAANYAWANRQCLMYLARGVFERVFNKSYASMGMNLIYDVAHNIAKIETHKVNGKDRELCVHRKGATRAFGPGHPALTSDYKDMGQPVIIPGDMGRNSYLLVGTAKAMDETFGSSCHGAGRLKSRHEAKRNYNASELVQELKKKGIVVMASSRGTIAEEAPGAYKDVNDVVDVVHRAGIAKKVCRMRPLGVIKG